MVLRFLFNFLLLSAVVNLYGAEKIPPPEIKVAIVAQDVKGEFLTDPVTAELSGRNVICVERAEIKKVLAEQKLSASGLVDPANIVKCCQLLKVDLFTVIVCSPKTQAPAEVIVFDTKLGIRLADICLPEKFYAQVKLTADTVTAAIARQQQLNAGKLKLISFMPLNLIALNGKEADSARLAELVLMRRLGQNQSILLLERSQLDFLLKERSLHPDNDNQLLAGSLFIQLEPELSGDKVKPLTMKLFAKDITGKVYFSLRETYAIDGEVKAAEHLAAETSRQLGTTVVTGNFDRKSEADKYISECNIAQANGMYERASRMARNAYVLNPDFRYELIRIEAEIAHAYLSGSDFGGDIPPEAAEAGVGHAEFLLGIEGNSEEIESRILTIMYDLAGIRNYYCDTTFPPQLKARITELRKQAGSTWLKRYNRQYKPVTEVNSAMDMQNIIQHLDAIKTIVDISKDYDIGDKYGLPLKELYVANIDRFYTPDMFLEAYGIKSFEPWQSSKTPRLAELYRAMQKTKVSYFKIIGTIFLHGIDSSGSRNDHSYTNFIVGIIDKDQISDQQWESIISYLNIDYIPGIPCKDGVRLCRSIYKKKGLKYAHFGRINYNVDSDAWEIYTFLKEIEADARNDKKLTDAARNEIITCTETFSRVLKRSFPKLQISVQDPPKRNNVFRRLFSLVTEEFEQFSSFAQPLYDSKNIYVAKMNRAERFLYRVSPEHGFSQQAGVKILRGDEQVDSYVTDKYFACLSEKYYITATTVGLFLFPLNLSTPEYVPLKEFKDFNCYGIASLSDKVYISYDGSVYERKTPLFLVEYDLQKKSYSVIYSSNQSENNPFVNCDLHRFSRMYADTIRNRLIVPAWRTSITTSLMTESVFNPKKTGLSNSINALSVELWALNLTSRSWVKLTDIPYFTSDDYPRYSPFIVGKNENTLLVMGDDVVYEFDLVSNKVKLKFFSGQGDFFKYFPQVDNSLRMKDYEKWENVNNVDGHCIPVDLDGNKLWTDEHLIFMKQKKTIMLIAEQGDDTFQAVFFKLKRGNFIIGSNNSGRCVPSGKLMVMELKSDSELLNLPELEDIAP